MMRIETILAVALTMGLTGGVAAAAAPSLPPRSTIAVMSHPRGAPGGAPAGAATPGLDCGAKQRALDDARATRDAAGKPDLSPCAGKKGAQKKECLAPLRDRARASAADLRQKVADARKALRCCKNPGGKSCARG